MQFQSPAPTKASYNTTAMPEDHCKRSRKTTEKSSVRLSPGIDREATVMKSHQQGCLNTG